MHLDSYVSIDTVASPGVYSTCLGKCTFEEGYTLQENAHAAFLISKGDKNKGYLKFNYITFLEDLRPCLLKTERCVIKLTNAQALIVNFHSPNFFRTAFML
jgi:hypothetical protein